MGRNFKTVVSAAARKLGRGDSIGGLNPYRRHRHIQCTHYLLGWLDIFVLIGLEYINKRQGVDERVIIRRPIHKDLL